MNVHLLVNKGATHGRKIQLRHETTIVGRRLGSIEDCDNETPGLGPGPDADSTAIALP